MKQMRDQALHNMNLTLTYIVSVLCYICQGFFMMLKGKCQISPLVFEGTMVVYFDPGYFRNEMIRKLDRAVW